MLRTWKIAKIIGVDIELHFTVGILLLLVVVGTLDTFLPRGILTAGIMSLMCGVMIVASIVAHELSHCYVARLFNLPVRRMIIFVLGGAAFMEREPRSGREELCVGGIGPVFSFVMGVVFFIPCLVYGVVPNFLHNAPAVLAVLLYTSIINFLLAVFNIIPAYPMDGGRVLRGIIWQITGKYRKSGKIAGLVGQIFSGLIILLGVIDCIVGGGGVLLIVIGAIMLWQGNAFYRKMKYA